MEGKKDMNTRILERKGNNALLESEDCDISCTNEYMLTCALNFQIYMGMYLFDNGAKESVRFSVSSHAPQEVKDELLQIARKYFESISQ